MYYCSSIIEAPFRLKLITMNYVGIFGDLSIENYAGKHNNFCEDH